MILMIKIITIIKIFIIIRLFPKETSFFFFFVGGGGTLKTDFPNERFVMAKHSILIKPKKKREREIHGEANWGAMPCSLGCIHKHATTWIPSHIYNKKWNQALWQVVPKHIPPCILWRASKNLMFGLRHQRCSETCWCDIINTSIPSITHNTAHIATSAQTPKRNAGSTKNYP